MKTTPDLDVVHGLRAGAAKKGQLARGLESGRKHRTVAVALVLLIVQGLSTSASAMVAPSVDKDGDHCYGECQPPKPIDPTELLDGFDDFDPQEIDPSDLQRPGEMPFVYEVCDLEISSDEQDLKAQCDDLDGLPSLAPCDHVATLPSTCGNPPPDLCYAKPVLDDIQYDCHEVEVPKLPVESLCSYGVPVVCDDPVGCDMSSTLNADCFLQMVPDEDDLDVCRWEIPVLQRDNDVEDLVFACQDTEDDDLCVALTLAPGIVDSVCVPQGKTVVDMAGLCDSSGVISGNPGDADFSMKGLAQYTAGILIDTGCLAVPVPTPMVPLFIDLGYLDHSGLDITMTGTPTCESRDEFWDWDGHEWYYNFTVSVSVPATITYTGSLPFGLAGSTVVFNIVPESKTLPYSGGPYETQLVCEAAVMKDSRDSFFATADAAIDLVASLAVTSATLELHVIGMSDGTWAHTVNMGTSTHAELKVDPMTGSWSWNGDWNKVLGLNGKVIVHGDASSAVIVPTGVLP